MVNLLPLRLYYRSKVVFRISNYGAKLQEARRALYSASRAYMTAGIRPFRTILTWVEIYVYTHRNLRIKAVRPKNMNESGYMVTQLEI
jgi:hypothetical protein